MPGAPDREVPIPVRRFQGTMLAMDPAFVPPGFLVRCENWVPNLSLVVSKRLGSAPWQRFPAPGRVDPVVYCSGSDGNRYLYSVSNDQLYVSVNDGPLTGVTNGAFTAGPVEDLRYGAAVVADTLYVGNDGDPIKQVPLGGAAVDLVPLALLDDTGYGATAIADELARVLAGTYSFRWAIYHTPTKRWTKVGPVRIVTTDGSGRQRLGFQAPTVALGTGELYHLFLAGVDQEIEGAHDQTPAGLPASSGADQFALWDDPAVESATVPIPSTVSRRGAHLVAHRGRLWGAGGLDATARHAWATNVLVPGLEQSLYDQGLFFPAGAVTPDLGGPVTALAVATLSSTNRSPTSPLGLMTETSTWLFFGDPLDDPTAQLVQVSDEIGCIGDRTVASTPLGVLFCGKRSVYLLTPQQAEPKDVGWPIEPAIRQIPVPERPNCWAIYHRGFYKLALVTPGETTPTQQWWLDLRRGLGDPPQWWGPHTTPAYTAAARATNHPAEEDRAWAAQDSSVAMLVLLDQTDRYTDPVAPRTGGQWNVAHWNVDHWAQEQNVPIVSRIVTADLDGGAPLTPKIAKRARIVANVFESTSLGITITADHTYGIAGTMNVPIATGDVWETANWDTASWAMQTWILSEFECTVPEPRGRVFHATLTHVDPNPCDLRDFELRVQPSSRETR